MTEILLCHFRFMTWFLTQLGFMTESCVILGLSLFFCVFEGEVSFVD